MSDRQPRTDLRAIVHEWFEEGYEAGTLNADELARRIEASRGPDLAGRHMHEGQWCPTCVQHGRHDGATARAEAIRAAVENKP